MEDLINTFEQLDLINNYRMVSPNIAQCILLLHETSTKTDHKISLHKFQKIGIL